MCVFELTLAFGSGDEAGTPLPRFVPPSLGLCLSVFLSFRASFFNFARRTLDMSPVWYLQMRRCSQSLSTSKSILLGSTASKYYTYYSLERRDKPVSSDGVYSAPLLGYIHYYWKTKGFEKYAWNVIETVD